MNPAVPTDNEAHQTMTTDWSALSRELEGLLKLRAHVFGMKLFEHREEMEAIPRISRAQSMDVLSSQANLAGYRAVIEAAESFGRSPRRLRAHRSSGRASHQMLRRRKTGEGIARITAATGPNVSSRKSGMSVVTPVTMVAG